jgi:hypothetical protein
MLNRQRLVALVATAAIGISAPGLARGQVVTDTTGTIAENEFVVSGFAGPTFGSDIEETDAGFGGAFTYLHRGMVGAEFIANFTPDLNFDSGLAEDGNVNNYMVNGIVALPLGEAGRWQPYVSGGLGAMTLSATLEDPTDVFDVDDTQLAGNIGFGLMGFGERWGFRTGMRYIAGLNDDPVPGNIDAPSDLVDPNDALGEVAFWRADAGIAYRW